VERIHPKHLRTVLSIDAAAFRDHSRLAASADKWLHVSLIAAIDPESHRWMDGKLVQFGVIDPPSFG
jgi:hypothetical protein